METYERYRFQDFPWLDKDFPDAMKFLENEKSRELGLYLPKKITSHTQLKQILDLASKNGFLAALMLDNCKLGKEGIKLLAEYLKKDDKLRYLFLENNNIDDAGVKLLVKAMEENKTLKSVWLGRNKMTNAGVAEFSEFVIESKQIKEFSIGGEKMDDDGALYVARAIHKSDQLTSVHLLDNKIKEHGAQLLAEVGSNHANIKTVEIHSPEMPATKFSELLRDLAEKEREMAFKEAVENGEEGPWLRCKIMVIGQGRAGKTATVRSLLNMPFNDSLDSTVGAEISTSKANSDKSWDQPDTSARVDLAVDAASRLAMLKLRKQKNDKEEAFNLDSIEEVKAFLDNAKKEKAERDKQKQAAQQNIIPKNLQDEINQNYNAQLITNKDATVEDIEFTIWDYGGQKVFYTLHHLFLTQYGIYMLVFDMRDVICPDLNETVEEDYRKKRAKQIECREYIEFWLNSVSMHAAQAPILIIGTFMDVIKDPQQLRKVDKFIADILGNKYSSVQKNNGLNFFPLNNKEPTEKIDHIMNGVGGGRGGVNIDTIRETVDEVSRKQAFVNQKLSLRWIKCLDTMLQQPGDFINLEKVRDIGKSCGITETTEIDNLLKFFHELGMIVHLDSTEHLKAIVTIKPQWLINELSKVIRDSHLHPFGDAELRKAGMTEHYQRILTQSIASRDWLEYLWPKERVHFLVDLMKRTMLLSEWKFGEFKKEAAFLVPSLIEKEGEGIVENIAGRLVQFVEEEVDIDKEVELYKKEGCFKEGEGAKKGKLPNMFKLFKGKKNPKQRMMEVETDEFDNEAVDGEMKEVEIGEDGKPIDPKEKEEEKKPEGFYSDDDKANGIVFDFRKSFLPNGVFQRLLCLCLLKVDVAKQVDASPLLHKSSAAIKMGDGQEFKLYQHQKQILCTVEKDFLSSYKVLLSMMQKLKADVMGKGLEWDVYLETVDPAKTNDEGKVFHSFVNADDVMKNETAPWFHEGKHKQDEQLILKKVGVELEDFLADISSF